MILKDVIFEDIVNYKIISMTLLFPYCNSFKCGQSVCQNGTLADAPDIIVDTSTLIDRYLDNPLTHAVVLQGLEPLDSWEDVKTFIQLFREKSDDDIVIYTGYNKCEIQDKIRWLKTYKNIIIKYGRFIPNQKPHYDNTLGVELASDNQFAEVIS